MNKKLMGVLIPVLGGLAIVGSGFSAWYFGESTYNDQTTGIGDVTGLVEEGTLDLGSKAVKVTLDQVKLFKNDVNAYEENGLGIIVTEGNMGTTDKYFGFVFDAGNDTVADADLPYTAVKASVTLENAKDASKNDTNKVKNYINVKVLSGITDGKLNLKGESTVKLGFEWVTGMKPTNYNEYCQMLDDLSGTDNYFDDTKKEPKKDATGKLVAADGLTNFTFSVNVAITLESK